VGGPGPLPRRPAGRGGLPPGRLHHLPDRQTAGRSPLLPRPLQSGRQDADRPTVLGITAGGGGWQHQQLLLQQQQQLWQLLPAVGDHCQHDSPLQQTHQVAGYNVSKIRLFQTVHCWVASAFLQLQLGQK
jgi:hypothetical protein